MQCSSSTEAAWLVFKGMFADAQYFVDNICSDYWARIGSRERKYQIPGVCALKDVEMERRRRVGGWFYRVGGEGTGE